MINRVGGVCEREDDELDEIKQIVGWLLEKLTKVEKKTWGSEKREETWGLKYFWDCRMVSELESVHS